MDLDADAPDDPSSPRRLKRRDMLVAAAAAAVGAALAEAEPQSAHAQISSDPDFPEGGYFQLMQPNFVFGSFNSANAAAMNWDVPFAGHPSLASGELAGLVERPENWKKVYAIGYKSCSYDASGKLPPKSEELVARLTKAGVALNDTLLWWVSCAVDAVNLIADAVQQTGSVRNDDIIRHWNTLKAWPGYYGEYSYTPEDHNGYPGQDVVMSDASSGRNGAFALAPGYA